MLKNQSLFMQQSCLDSWNGYESSIVKHHFIHWDFVIITASNEEQAESYRLQITGRLSAGRLPENVHYAILPDTDGKRVGSGGATLNALRYISEHIAKDEGFKGQRILLIHSGGDSKRVPQYSACGKLFSPVPRVLPDGRRSTLFDEIIISASGIPSRMKDGMLVVSGDALLLFNPLQIDFNFGGVSALSIPESVEVGCNHGVFLGDGNGFVKYFLHKQPVSELTRCGAVNDFGKVSIDTGAVLLGSDVLNDLFSLICVDGKPNDSKLSQFVNDVVRLSFYGDFLYPMADCSSREQYFREKAECEIGCELHECREAIWGKLSKYTMRLLQLSPSCFMHYGTTRELLELFVSRADDFYFLGWSRKILSDNRNSGGYACSNALVDFSARVAHDSYIEDSRVGAGVSIGKGCVISNVDLENVNIPDHTVLHGARLKNGKYTVRIYGVNDNPKGGLNEGIEYLGATLDSFFAKAGEDSLWNSAQQELWTAKIFPLCDDMKTAVDSACMVYAIVHGDAARFEKWKAMSRESLSSSFTTCDIRFMLDRQKEIQQEIEAVNVLSAAARKDSFANMNISKQAARRLETIASKQDFSTRIRLHYYLSTISGFELAERERFEDKCYSDIQQTMMDDNLSRVTYRFDWQIASESVEITLPLRVNWGGGWSDTPPYCLENGGTVLNAAITVNGKQPVIVEMKKLNDLKVVFESADSNAYSEFHLIDELRDHNNPFDMFALHKASLLACGVIPADGEYRLEDLLSRLGGGIYLSTQVIGIPRGSGLGTSSILAGACIKAIFSFFGQPLKDDELYNLVLCTEQLMSTGGGWQDQIGGLVPGIKFITTPSGLRQDFKVERVFLSECAKNELSERFVLINTGQRRLARNLLREIIGRYIAGNPDAVYVLHKIQRVAALMKFELEKGDIDGFAELLNEHWELSKKLDENSSNTCIEQIFTCCEPLIVGKMICGAGGGGFLQVVLKKGATKEQLAQKLREMFGDSGAAAWDSEFVFE